MDDKLSHSLKKKVIEDIGNGDNLKEEDFSDIQYMEDEDLFVSTLFRYNQNYILDKITQLISQNQYTTFSNLKSSLSSSSSRSICGKVWKGNSHIYKCLDCQIDENCAICVDCFEEDKHIGHRYRLIPSSNGCCDCGDLSAWKKEGCCSVHVKKEDQASKINSLPVNTKKILVDLLFKKLIKEITKSVYSKQEEVIVEVLIKFIDIFGDALSILLGDYVVSITTQYNRQSVLRSLCSFASKPESNLEKFIISLFINSEFRDILALSMAEAFDDDKFDSNLTVQLFTVDSTSLKIVSKNKFKHIVNSLYKSVYISRIGYNNNNNNNNNKNSSNSNNSQNLIDNEKSSSEEQQLEDNNNDILKNDKIEDNLYDPWLLVDGKNKSLKQTDYFKSLTSIAYIIKTKSSFLWLMRNSKLLLKCLDILALVQGMNPNIRLTDSHIEFEDQSWKTMLSLEIFLQRFISRSISKQMDDNYKLINEIESIKIRDHLLKRIIQFYQASGSSSDNYSNKWKKGIKDQIIPDYCISKQPVSIHAPLHRVLFKVLYFQSLHFNRSPREVLKSISSSPNFESIIVEHIIRVLVLTYQCKAGMWVRNGDSILNQIANYNFGSYEFNSLDIYLLQYILLSMDTKQFYAQILDRSELSSWFQLDGNFINDNNKSLFSSISNKLFNHSGDGTGGGNQSPNQNHTHPLLNNLLNHTHHQNNSTKSELDRTNILIAEKFLDTIIWLVNDRKNLSNLSGNQLLRKELVHILAVKPQTYSEVYPRVSEEYEESIELDKILNEISVYQNATTTEAGKFKLKAEVWNEWNYFYPHYLKNEQQKSEESFQAHCRKEKIENIYAKPLVKLEEPLEIFKGIETLLHSEILHSIIFSIIYNNLSGSNKTSETLLTSALYLLYLSFETYNDNQINKEKRKKEQQDSQIKKQQQKSQLKYSELNNLIDEIVPTNLYQQNSNLSPSISKSHSIPKSSSPPKSSSLSFFSSPFASKSLSPPKSSPPKSMISAYQSNVSTPIKIATSLGLVSNNKSNNESKYLDIGFTSDDILKNFIHPIKLSSNNNNNNSINLVSMLTHMNNLPKFEIHHPIISKIINHNIIKSNNNNNNQDDNNNNNNNNNSSNSELSKSPNINDSTSNMKEMAKKKQMEMMKLMKEQQSKFFKNSELNAYYYDDGLDDEDDDVPEDSGDDDEYFSDANNDEFLDNELFYFEKDEPLTDLGNCVICRDELCVNSISSSSNSNSNNNNRIGYIGTLHKHSLLSYTSLLSMDPSTQEEIRRIDKIYKNKNQLNQDAALTIDMYDTDGPFINFCSHLIHINCLDSLLDIHNNNPLWPRHIPRLQEFQCPVCRGRSNIIVPYSKKRVSTIKLNHFLKQKKSKYYHHQQQESITTSPPPTIDENEAEFIKQEFNNWLELILDPNNLTDAPKIDNAKLVEQQEKYDSFTKTIYSNSIISKSFIDQIQHLYNIIDSCISVYELSKRNSQFDFNNFKLIRKPFNNLIKQCIEQSTNNIIQRKYELEQLVKILANNNGNNNSNKSSKFIKLDMFGLFIRFYFTNESLITFRSSNNNDIKLPNSPISFLISVFFIGTLLQSLIYHYNFNNIQKIIEFLNNNNINSLDNEVKRNCLSYLRKVCFFLICIDINIDVFEYNQRETIEQEFDALLKLIKNSSGVELSIEMLSFNNSTLNKVISEYWLSNEYLDVPTPYQLEIPLRSWRPFTIKTQLPQDYLKYFLENTTKKSCSECEGRNGQVKFMCLLCDKRLCSKDFVLHANEDLDIHPIGCYLFLNETAIIVTHLRKTKIWGTVYLDQHGAEDYGLRRGKPLTLNRDRLNKLNEDIINLNIISLQTININR